MTLNITVPENINDTKPKISVIGIGGAGGNAEKVADAGVTRESGYLYFIDKDGDVSRAPMARGRG